MPRRLAELLRPHLLANQFPPLHGLRVVALLTVLQVHVSVVFVRAGLMTSVAFARRSATVWFGIDMFFVISGFLIGTIVLGKRATTPGRFYARRSLRIFPLYYVALTLIALLAPLRPAQSSALVYEYLYLTNYHEFRDARVMGWAWSLCVEEHFYLAVPLFVAAVRLFKTHAARVVAMIALWMVPLLVRLVVWRTTARWNDDLAMERMYMPTHARFDSIVAGILLAYLHEHYKPELARLLDRRWARALCAAIALAGVAFLCLPWAYPERFLWDALAWGTVTSVAYVALLLPMLVGRGGAIARALSARPFLPLATLSYGVYLVHVPVCERLVVPLARIALEDAALPFAPVWCASVLALFAFSLAVAYLLHLVVEKPALWLRDRLAP